MKVRTSANLQVRHGARPSQSPLLSAGARLWVCASTRAPHSVGSNHLVHVYPRMPSRARSLLPVPQTGNRHGDSDQSSGQTPMCACAGMLRPPGAEGADGSTVCTWRGELWPINLPTLLFS